MTFVGKSIWFGIICMTLAYLHGWAAIGADEYAAVWLKDVSDAQFVIGVCSLILGALSHFSGVGKQESVTKEQPSVSVLGVSEFESNKLMLVGDNCVTIDKTIN